MKKAFCLGMAVLLLVLCAGCGGKTEDETAASVTEASAAIDIDLTELTSTMVYSEVYGMMSEPDAYIGKTVKAKGPFGVYQNEETGEYFFAVVIRDATACCAQGLEFVWEGDHPYPDDYPEQGAEIVVSGTFNTYIDGTQQYCHLENAAMQLA